MTDEVRASSEGESLRLHSADVQYRLAAVWQAKGQVERAIAGYEEAIRLQPEYVPAHLELGQLLVQGGRIDEAIAAYRRAAALLPQESRFTQALHALLGGQKQAGAADGVDTPPPPEGGGRDRPHIVLYSDCSGISGAEQWNHALTLTLAARGMKVTCVQGRAENHLIDQQERAGIAHIWLDDDTLYHPSRPARALDHRAEPQRILEEARPDLIIFSDGAPMSSLAAKEVARDRGIPFVIVVHCVAAAWADRYAGALDRLAAIYADAGETVAVSHANLRLLHGRFGLPPDRGRVIVNGRPDRFFARASPAVKDRVRGELGIPPGAVVVCTVASLELRKGHGYLLKAIKNLRQSPAWSRLHFIWIGTGTIEPQLRAVVERLGVSDRVRFLGEREDVADVLDASDIFVLTSTDEGMPFSVMEAMARGLAVAATAVGGVPEELGDTGRLLPDPTRTPEATVSALTKTLALWTTDESMRHAVGNACRSRAETLFREERMLDEWLQLLEPALARHRQQGNTSPASR